MSRLLHVHEQRLRILIVRLSHLGDVVQALPLLEALRAAQPSAEIAWAVQPEFADLLRDRREIDSLVLFHRRGGASAWARLRRDLEAFGANWSIDAQGNVKSALVSLASGAPRRSGFARADWTEKFAASSVNDPAAQAVGSEDGVVHAMQRMEALVRHVVPGAGPLAQPSGAPASVMDARLGEAWFDAWFGSARGPLAVLHLAGERDVRAWPAASFVELARDLSRDHDVLVLAGPGERAEGLVAQQSLAGTARVRCVTDQSGLSALEAFLRAASRRGAVFVGCDSGPMHVAWSAGLTVVLLAGPQDERRTGPWPLPGSTSTERTPGEGHARGHRIVRAAVRPACAPCCARTCTHPDGAVCMSRIDPMRVALAVRAATNSAATMNAATTGSATNGLTLVPLTPDAAGATDAPEPGGSTLLERAVQRI